MTTFNYRVVLRNDEYAVHEVFYDDDGRPESLTVDALSPTARSVRDLRYELEKMLKSLDCPVLREEDIGVPGMHKCSAS